MPQLCEVNDWVRGADRLPSLSTTTTVAVQVPEATSATNVGCAAVMSKGVVLVLAGGRVSDHRNDAASMLLKQSDVGAAVERATMSSRKNIPGA